MFYSLRQRLLITFIVLLIIPFTAMVLVLTQMSNKEIGNSIEESTSQTMDQYASFVNTLTNQVEDVANQVLSNDVTQQWIGGQMNPSLPENRKVLLDAELRKFLSSIALNHSYISSITLFDSNGVAVGISDQTFRDASYMKSEWYTAFKQEERRWTSAHLDKYQPSSLQHEQVNSLLFNLVHLSSFQNIGILKVNVLSEDILKPLQKIKFGETGRVYLLDAKGMPVLNQTLPPEMSGFSSVWPAIQADKHSGGKIIVTPYKKRHLVLYRKLLGSDWVVIGEVPESELFQKMTRVQQTMLAVAGGLLLLTIAAAYWLSKSIANPLSLLVQSMKLAERGELAAAERQIVERMPRKRTEVGYATRVFHAMVTRLRFLIETEFHANMRRKDAEYKALLMQINPHFLYNTLEAIGSLSAQGRTDDVVDVTESLGQMLRFSLRTDNDLVQLKEELRYIRHYVSILRIRFGNRLDIAISAETELGNESIVKFIFQPLVENAVKFSLENASTALVRVGVRGEGKDLLIQISDNGPGMPQEMIQEIYAQMTQGEMSDVLGASGRRIGLRNVLARCHLYYGERLKVSIRSSPEHGTEITLQIPRSEGEVNVQRIVR
ncbi:two-component system sensor histidine kinase YesM [Paenibacillus taihuensis]|uniref:histidine kinase n=1 Tax=Paenibacillus taihuensis TaxID=1156355 RepID=A0A3D9SBH4_9BACL|nr:histidine kinase [Paenibacillus taihuensis]REE90634.1 two-component system sensor histidine kinase YesM [Paenibacillus taihuensis]